MKSLETYRFILISTILWLHFSELGGLIRNGDVDVELYRNKVKRMFYHAYEGYLKYAYPYDELKPLSCTGHDTWGSYSLTLIDALDTLAVMGNFTEFRRVANLIISKSDGFFDLDINVSVFETNIRIVGGLLSAHLLMKKAGMEVEPAWPCSGPLLRMADNIARKILPAFDTPTGMPYGTVNLHHGVPKGETTVTCTAGVGTFIVEFGTLSRLSGDPIFEKTAMRAIRALWKYRSSVGLLGNHIDVSTGRWTALDSGIGGGVDSYFEYLVKGSVMFNNAELLHMFREYEVSIKNYLKRDDWYLWGQMNKGSITLPVFTSLDCYWPGIKSMLGDIDEAGKTMHNYHQVWRQFGFTPEYYNIPKAEAQSGREGYPLRPELVESAVYMYRATKDPYYLKIGVDIVEAIEHSARTSCGYATVKDVRDHKLEDRMESFFLAETTKYLYLLFDPDNFIHNNGSSGQMIETTNGPCVIDAGGYIFNTEAHPIDLAAVYCCSAEKKKENQDFEEFHNNIDLTNFLDWELDEDGDIVPKTKWKSILEERTLSKINESKSNKSAASADNVDTSEIKRNNITNETSPEQMERLVELQKNLSRFLVGETKLDPLVQNMTTEFAKKLNNKKKTEEIETLLNELVNDFDDLQEKNDKDTDIMETDEQSVSSDRENISNVEDKLDRLNNLISASISHLEKNKVQEQTLEIQNNEQDATDKKPDTSKKVLNDQEKTIDKINLVSESEEKTDVSSSTNNKQISKDLSDKNSEVSSNFETNLNLNDVIKNVNLKSNDENDKDDDDIEIDENDDVDIFDENDNNENSDDLLSERENKTTSDSSHEMDPNNESINKESSKSKTIYINVNSLEGLQEALNQQKEVDSDKIVVVHLGKEVLNRETEKEDENIEETEEPSTVNFEKGKSVKQNLERLKAHLERQLLQQPSPVESESKPKPSSSLQNKRHNLLSLTRKILNLFSSSSSEDSDSSKERKPSLSGLYSSLANYQLQYFQDPSAMHCPAQPFHSKLSVNGEMFTDQDS